MCGHRKESAGSGVGNAGVAVIWCFIYSYVAHLNIVEQIKASMNFAAF